MPAKKPVPHAHLPCTFFYIVAKLQQGFPLPNPYNISFVNSDIEVLEVRF